MAVSNPSSQRRGFYSVRGVSKTKSLRTGLLPAELSDFQALRAETTDLHAKHGVPLSEEQRDRLAAAVIHDAKNNQLGSIKELRFSEDKAGKIQPDGHVFAFNGDPTKVTTVHSATHIPQAQETPVEQSFKQMAKAVQQPQQQQQQQAAQSQAPGTPVSSHPGGR